MDLVELLDITPKMGNLKQKVLLVRPVMVQAKKHAPLVRVEDD